MKRPMLFRQFYPGDCGQQIAEFLKDFHSESGPKRRRAAAAPHAGWRYSGGVAARTLKVLAASRPEVIVILSAVHRSHLDRAVLYPRGSWETPLGEVEVDADLGAEILDAAPELLESDPDAHFDEHAAEVLMPFIREILPDARVVPIMVPPDTAAVQLGTAIAGRVADRRAAAVASTDLTHYGWAYQFTPAGTGEKAHEWMRANDQRIVDLALRLEAEKIVPEARSHQNACGSGALAAAVAFARALGSPRGILVERTDSHEAVDPGSPFEMAVGYAGMVF
ncbi:MAG: AmmeMemoRadiSam system protein B [Planctomycetes bacterium]|nr:AmmeMemoRadiSam system protein B [Planctomycetota bacterium]